MLDRWLKKKDFALYPPWGYILRRDQRVTHSEMQGVMPQRSARKWIGLIACMFMQVGLFMAIVPARAQHAPMLGLSHTHSAVQHELCSTPHDVKRPPAHQHSSHGAAGPQGDACCHIHQLLSDSAVQPVAQQEVPSLGIGARLFFFASDFGLRGAARSPLLRPPRLQTV